MGAGVRWARFHGWLRIASTGVFLISLLHAAALVIDYVKPPVIHTDSLWVRHGLWLPVSTGIMLVISGILLAYYSRSAPRIERSFNLPYVPGDPETSYAPERWSTQHRRKSVKVALVETMSRYAWLVQECTVFKEHGCPKWTQRSKFDAAVDPLLTQLTKNRQHLVSHLRHHETGEPIWFVGDDVRMDYSADLRQALRALQDLQIRYAYMGPPKPERVRSPIEREFINVFFNKTEADRERIIELWIQKKQCSREEAITLALEQWQRDNRSWR